jgi:hypothetical protein
MRNFGKTLIMIGMCAAAGGARAATLVVADTFDYKWTQSSSPPYTTTFTLVPSSPTFVSAFDPSLGTLESLEIDWSPIELSAQGYGILGNSATVLGALIGSVAAATSVGGYTIPGSLHVEATTTGAGPISFHENGNAIDVTFDKGNNPNNVFTDAANGDALDIAWKTGAVRTVRATSLQPSENGLIVLGISQGPDLTPLTAKLRGDLTVTYAYDAAPEISTWAMMLAGFAGLGLTGWRGPRKAGLVFPPEWEGA